MKMMVLVGPWGSSEGKNWSFKPDGKITNIIIRHGGCIDSISFSTLDDNNTREDSDRFGGSGGNHSEVCIDIDLEELNCVSGTVGWFSSKMVVTSLSFSTNLYKFGPFGMENGTHFSVPVSRATFAGFFGHYDDYLRAIGVILEPA